MCSVNSYDKETYLKLSTVSIQRQTEQPQSNRTHASQQFFTDQKSLLLNYNHLRSKSFRNLDFHGTWNNPQMFPEWAAHSSFANFQMLNSLLFPHCHQGKALRHLSHAERDYAVMCLPSTSWNIFDKVCNYITQDRRGCDPAWACRFLQVPDQQCVELPDYMRSLNTSMLGILYSNLTRVFSINQGWRE